MFGEIEVLKSDVVNFPLKPQERENSEVRKIENREVLVEKTTGKKEIRFARLKKSLRKRSASIL